VQQALRNSKIPEWTVYTPVHIAARIAGSDADPTDRSTEDIAVSPVAGLPAGGWKGTSSCGTVVGTEGSSHE